MKAFRRRNYSLGIYAITLIHSLLTTIPIVRSQSIPSQSIVTDSTLPNNSIVTLSNNTYSITGGTPAGKNLFHSFERFSLATGQNADFENASNIENIITRVTGKSISNIDGLIRANGNTNLFLLNPNGVVFGANAALDIGGSFFVSTADAWKFPEGDIYSATDTATSPILIISTPIGVQWGANVTGEIINEANLFTNRDLDLSAANITSRGNITDVNGNLNINALGDVNLLFATMQAGEDITVKANSLTLNQAALLTKSSNIGSTGTIDVEVTDNINLNNHANIGSSNDGGIGNAGEINLKANSLRANNASSIIAQSIEPGNSGKINLAISGDITLNNSSNIGIFIISRFQPNWINNDNNIEIKAGNLSILNGSQIITDIIPTIPGRNVQIRENFTRDFKAANINIQVGERISIEGFSIDKFTQEIIPSQISSKTSTGATTNGGNITLMAANLSIANQGLVSVRSDGQGNAGNIKIDTNTFKVQSGGKIMSSISSFGNAGDIQVITHEKFLLTGTKTRLLADTTPNSAGNGGNIFVNSPNIKISNSAWISTNSQGKGKGGNIQLQTKNITFNRGNVSTETAFGEGGNINLIAGNYFQFLNNSSISTTARGTGNGGNINIKAGFIVSNPQANSDIIANTIQGRGGNINISSDAILGLEMRSQLTSRSDITTSSQSGVSGKVIIDTLNIDPSRGNSEQSTEVIDASSQINQTCSSQSTANSFTIVRRGGLPLMGNEILNSTPAWIDWRIQGEEREEAADKQRREEGEFIEATGWEIGSNGVVKLVAMVSPNTSNLIRQSFSNCLANLK
ncbi:filamentous hemagglutinin N-terminal domain-containing protein [Calothrix sp. UHCC 0171]|uniref:two-partner secretion domain-containing protein n=1 Tax=Calothrix sp. UHCC 0171 TaxID=3110245 RepID=UPI002B1FDC26|nr:filamentous hemagglutinin N-terminal domain-containing protein [Calothrix sp. UHCC 0171]MEA5570720.1 filamentous hemagglutinin N-terminal domain-containing protein [Calothrix sp. UHCC 0171]